MDSVASDWFWFWLPLLVVVVRALAVPSSLLVSWSWLTSLGHHNSNTCLIIIYGFHHRIIELAREVYRYRLKVPGFYLLGGVKKILIKLIYNNLKLKINI